MLKQCKDYKEKIQYAKDLLAIFNSDTRFKKIFDKKSGFPEKDFKNMIGNDASKEASDLSHIFNTGKDIYTNLANIASINGEPSIEEQDAIDQAFNTVDTKFTELYTKDVDTPSEKLNAYMQATKNSKVSKGVLPFVYGIVGVLEDANAKIYRDLNATYLDGLQDIENNKEIDRKIAVECAKNITDFAEKNKLDPKSLLTLSEKDAYVQAAKKAYASTVDLNKITDQKTLEYTNSCINKSIEYEIRRSDILRQNESIANDDMIALKDDYDKYIQVKAAENELNQKSSAKTLEINKAERQIAQSKYDLEQEYKTLDPEKLNNFRNELNSKKSEAEKINEYALMLRSLTTHKDEKVSEDYVEKVEAMKQYCQEHKGDNKCESYYDMNRIISQRSIQVYDEISNLKKDPKYKAESQYLKNEEAIAGLEKARDNAKTARAQLHTQAGDLSTTWHFHMTEYAKKAHNLMNLYNAKTGSSDVDKYETFKAFIQTKKDALIESNKKEIEKIDQELPNLTHGIYNYANRFGANTLGLDMKTGEAKRESIFTSLNTIRNSSITLNEKLPKIKEKEALIYDTGNKIRECTGVDQLKDMVNRLNAFLPDPDKKGNSTHYMAMHKAITDAQNLFNGDKKNITKESQLKAVQDIQKAAKNYLTAKGKQVRFWPFSSNQRYARILNAQSLEKAATKMEDIVKSMTPIEAKFENILGPEGKYNTNKPEYGKELMGDIFNEAKAPEQPQMVNDDLEIKQDQNVL